ncbi:MAG: hypothetical protein A2138_09795 [Deltaproteobacteria bacterium RBG_16_71_12]|nr:MAG: hypothetical protein A2138_09795 [Deltaproteobacteria bacterium RBG_16_71_12]
MPQTTALDDDDLPLVVGAAVTPAQPTPAQLAQQIDAAFAAVPLSPPSTSPLYVVALVIVGALALALPFLYLALGVSLAASGVALVVLLLPQSFGWISGSLVLGAGLGLVLAGLALLAPVFRRRKHVREPAIVVTRAGEPVLFHLVDRCARALGVATPDEVLLTGEANAAVIEDDDKRVALVLGLPLVAVLSVRELAGVVAHELGHVRQGWGRRFLVFVITSHGWFRGAIEDLESEADAADERVSLPEAAMSLTRAVALVVGLRLLALCLRLSDALITALATEMELDADRVEAHVAGAEAFASASEKICAAAVVLGETRLRARLGARELPDNLARWAAIRVGAMPRSERRRAARRITRDAAGVPHPPHEARVANAQRTNATGLPLPDAQGSALFRSFDAYATRATRDALFDVMRSGARFVPAESLVTLGGDRYTLR